MSSLHWGLEMVCDGGMRETCLSRYLKTPKATCRNLGPWSSARLARPLAAMSFTCHNPVISSSICLSARRLVGSVLNGLKR